VLEVSNIVGNLILKGDTVEAAVNASKAKASSIMLKMLASSEPYDAAAFLALFQNSSALSFEGDRGARA
jgi:hypothetical protein